MMTKEKARAEITALINKYQQLKNDKAQFGRTSEEDVVNHFITPLLRTLGWRLHFPAIVQIRTPHPSWPTPYRVRNIWTKTVHLCRGEAVWHYRTAIRNTVHSVLTPRQMQQPGWATDRTKEEQQAINYAFENDGTWAILTNFERFRLFNARQSACLFD